MAAAGTLVQRLVKQVPALDTPWMVESTAAWAGVGCCTVEKAVVLSDLGQQRGERDVMGENGTLAQRLVKQVPALLTPWMVDLLEMTH